MTKTSTQKPVTPKSAKKKAATKKPTIAFTGRVLTGMVFPFVGTSQKELNPLELYCLGFLAMGSDDEFQKSRFTIDYIHEVITQNGVDNVKWAEVMAAVETLSKYRLIKKNLLKGMKDDFGSPEKYFILGKRGEEFLSVLQLNLESDIKAFQR